MPARKWLVERLRQQQVEFIIKVRKNMKPVPRTPFDQALLRRQSLSETVFDELKNLCQVEPRATAHTAVSWSI